MERRENLIFVIIHQLFYLCFQKLLDIRQELLACLVREFDICRTIDTDAGLEL